MGSPWTLLPSRNNCAFVRLQLRMCVVARAGWWGFFLHFLTTIHQSACTRAVPSKLGTYRANMDGAEQERPAKRQRIGKACKSCRASKARCEIQQDADACHRCQVLEFVPAKLPWHIT